MTHTTQIHPMFQKSEAAIHQFLEHAYFKLINTREIANLAAI